MKSVSIITTVLNNARETAVLLDSLRDQVRRPEEFIIVDGGSSDGTVEVIREAAQRDPIIRWIEASGANIGRGRNIAIEQARGEIIASTDTGCRLDPNWLAEIVRPFEDEREADFVAGFYRIDPHTWFERVIGLSTMRGALDPVNPLTFNPSGRSVAYTKSLWRRAGGIPDFLAIDDTLFDAKVRSMGVRWVFAERAVVYWRPRGSFRGLAKQFHFYGTSAGHTGIFTNGTHYNLRNIALMLAATAAGFWNPWLWCVLAPLIGYFGVWAFHRKAIRVAQAMGSRRAYVSAIAVQWTILAADAAGYLTGLLQRWMDPRRYRNGLKAYMNGPVASPDERAGEFELAGSAA